MTYQTTWFETNLPTEIVDIIVREAETFENAASTAVVRSGIDLKVRDSKTSWFKENHWIAGLCMSYVLMANRANFQYDIEGFDGGDMQYTIYEPGQYYNWHQDAGIEALEQEKCRKLSVVLQLSDPSEYEGGEFQLLNESGKMYIAPKMRGTLIVFDSRTRHRVRKVHSGTRRSLVGWIIGPRWK